MLQLQLANKAEAAAGSIGQNSGSSFEYIIKYVGKFNTKEQYDNIIIKSLGKRTKLNAERCSKSRIGGTILYWFCTKRRQSCGKYGDFPNAGSNAQDIINNIKNVSEICGKRFSRRNSLYV